MGNKPKNRGKRRKEEQAARQMRDPETTDVLGSYTGTAREGGEPEQDADDL